MELPSFLIVISIMWTRPATSLTDRDSSPQCLVSVADEVLDIG